jgi:enterochelin esterase-like enzyme
MQDGQNLFDPATSAFGVDWELDETADSLIRKGAIKPIIIVGLANTRWRSAEYADNDTGYTYMKFIVNKVKPFIDTTYRTLPDPMNTAVGGSSQGALISFMLGWNYPDVFSKVICMSPALKISSINYVKNVEMYKGQRKNLKFYFDAGQSSLDSLLIPGTQDMIKALEEQGYKKGVDILWYIDKDGEHNEVSWGKRIWRPLLWFFSKEN